jgi:hypothetical protein
LKLVLDSKAALVRQNRINRLMVAGFIDRSEVVTPRGKAAFEAPTMTRKEYDMLVRIENGHSAAAYYTMAQYTPIKERGWASDFCLTPAGLTALNNMRAAMGSAEYQEQP